MSALKRRKAALGRFFTGVFAVSLVIFLSLAFGTFFSSAHGNTEEEPVNYKYYKSIRIERGDSLWSIAEEYMGPEYASANDYINEIAEINNIASSELDDLQEGDYLVVAYYDTTYAE